ncbi:diguanylate cyclase [Massilia sp. DWR3-1-1]|uniref:diguanylate cyclase n=1 Tax=Massilia sp. DWR3-1-1 TaxID=2804559 RepID=UPI003CE838C0
MIQRLADYLSLHLLRRIGIRRRLLLVFVLLALMPLLISGAIWYADSTAAIAERTRVLSTEVVKQVAKNIGVAMATIESDSEALALSEPVQESLRQYGGGDEAAMTTARRVLMRGLLERYGSSGFVSQKYLLDRDNRIIDTQVFSSLGRGVLQLVERSPRMLGRPYWTTFDTSTPELVLLRDIHSTSNNRLLGHLFLAIRPSYFAAIFEDVDLGRRSDIAVVDADSGRVLAGGGAPAAPPALAGQLRHAIDSGRRSGFLAHGAQLSAYARIADTNWFVTGTIARSRVTDEARAMLANGVIIGLAGLALSLALSLLLARSVATPLAELMERMRASAAGVAAAPLAADGKDELTVLAQQFNSMATSLQRHQEQLEQRVAERTRDLAAVNEQLAALSRTDALTSIANRRHFDDVLEQELQRAIRAGLPLALLMIDVDFFKSYNDHYGHQQGDDCLCQVAALLHAHARRASDLAARYGGEEFTLIAAATDGATAFALAEAIRAAIAALQMPHQGSPTGVLTVSIGAVSLLPTAATSAAQLLSLADQAMYRAKEQGRNQAVLSTTRLRP